ncbi:MAG: pitrilysin family protein [Candidatus Melainabacteria bacterium]|nr:pitrilysin family protein [Candidatus Melainabacteria bacterium]
MSARGFRRGARGSQPFFDPFLNPSTALPQTPMGSLTELAHLKCYPLENGMTWYHLPLEEAPRLAFSLAIPGGNAAEQFPGVADLTDNLLLKGTHRKNSEAVAIALDSLSLDLDISTRRDYSLMSGVMLEDDLEDSLALVAELFYEASFQEFELEKEKMMGEIQMELDSPRAAASDLYVKTLFAGTPYATTNSVVLQNLPQLTSVTWVQQHYTQHYRPERVVLVTAGPTPVTRLASLLERFFPPRKEPVISTPPATGQPLLAQTLQSLTVNQPSPLGLCRPDSNQAHIFKGWLSVAAVHEDYYPLAMMNTILGGAGLSARLFLELRDKRGLAYNVRSSLEAYCHRGMFSLYIGTDPARVRECLEGFEEECQKLIDILVDEQELADAKQNMLGRRAIFMETALQQAAYVANNLVLGRSIEAIQSAPDRFRAVTAQDLQRVAQTYLTQPAVVALVGPEGALQACNATVFNGP